MITKSMIDQSGLEPGYTLITKDEFDNIGKILAATARVTAKLKPHFSELFPVEPSEKKEFNFADVLGKVTGLFMNPAKMNSVKELFADKELKADFAFIIQAVKPYGIS